MPKFKPGDIILWDRVLADAKGLRIETSIATFDYYADSTNKTCYIHLYNGQRICAMLKYVRSATTIDRLLYA